MRPSFRPYFLSRPAFFMTPVRFWRGQSLRNVFILFFFYSIILGLARRKPYTLKHRLLKTVLAEIIWYHAPFILFCQKQFPDQVGWRVFSFSLWTKKAPWKGAWERGLLRTKKKGRSVGCDRDGQESQFIERFDLIAGAEFIIDIFYVLLNGIGADVQPVADLFVDIAHGHELEHFLLPACDGWLLFHVWFIF